MTDGSRLLTIHQPAEGVERPSSGAVNVRIWKRPGQRDFRFVRHLRALSEKRTEEKPIATSPLVFLSHLTRAAVNRSRISRSIPMSRRVAFFVREVERERVAIAGTKREGSIYLAVF